MFRTLGTAFNLLRVVYLAGATAARVACDALSFFQALSSSHGKDKGSFPS